MEFSITNCLASMFALDSYDGSSFLQFISQSIGFGIDKVNFFTCQLFGIIIAYLFRVFCHPKYFNIKGRHFFQVFVGVGLSYFCFGKQLSHIWLQLIVSYGLMKLIRIDISSKLVLVWCMGHLSFCHFTRPPYTDGNYNIDISGPLMICVQRLTSLAMNINDGQREDKKDISNRKLSNQRDILISKVPSLLETISYVFSFQSFFSGPLIFYKDYDKFITGKNLYDKNGNELKPEPKPKKALRKKLFTCVIILILFLIVSPFQNIEYVKNSNFDNQLLIIKWFMLYIFLWANLVKYQLTWKLAESANVAAGLGFQGYKENGEEDWSGADNLLFWEFEASSSIKTCLVTWNITTNVWLKYIVYERVRFARKWAVFGFSAIWHGFQIGYYVCAASCMILASIERRIRKGFNPLMEKFPKWLQITFRLLGWILFKLSTGFCGMPFMFLDMELYFKTMRSLYYSPIFLAIFGLGIIWLVRYYNRENQRAKKKL